MSDIGMFARLGNMAGATMSSSTKLKRGFQPGEDVNSGSTLFLLAGKLRRWPGQTIDRWAVGRLQIQSPWNCAIL
jgi:hypothetical protein